MIRLDPRAIGEMIATAIDSADVEPSLICPDELLVAPDGATTLSVVCPATRQSFSLVITETTPPGHRFVESASDPGNCGVCHFYHR